jgi:hypothetical protein
MRREEIEERRTENPPKSLFFAGESNWWLFCLAIVVLKFLLLAVDSSPKFYQGDSDSYIWTALSGWIPEDRPYFYGYVIGWLSVWTCSLTSLLIVQVFLGAIIAIALAWICRMIFALPEWLAYLFGFLCAIDPLQLTWERYVMPEIVGLFFYALVLHQSFVYLRSRRITTLVVIQVLSIITIGFQMTFLVPLQIMAAALPLIAFLLQSEPTETATASQFRPRQFFQRWIFWRHLAVSITVMFALDQGYRQANGFFSHREPAYIHSPGYFLLSTWAPAIRPQDSPDPRLGEIIRHGNEFDLKNHALRNAQRFSPGHLIDRWRRVETNKRKSEEIATRTAINAFRHNPAGVIEIAAKTYYAFWRGQAMEQYAKQELRPGKIGEGQVKSFVERSHFVGGPNTGAEPVTFSKWYYVAASPYYFAILLSPLLSLVLLFVARNKAHAVLLFAHTVLIFAVTFLVSIAPTIEYLLPLSLTTLLSVALAVKSLYPPASEDGDRREFSSGWRWREMNRRQQFCTAFGVLAVAAILRIGLAGNQPLWNDEIFSLAMVTGHSLEHPPAIANPALGDFVQLDRPESAEELCRYIKHDNPPAGPARVIRAVVLSDTHPPLYYLLLYGSTLAFGTSDFVLREFSIICSLACLPFLAGIARRTGGAKAVLPSCLLFAFSPLGISFSTEVRMYSFLWLWVLAIVWLSLVWHERGGGTVILAMWVATSAAGFLTHYFFVFPWAALVVFLLLRPGKVSRIQLMTCILFTALTIFPWYMRVPQTLHSWRIMKDWLKMQPPGFNRLDAARILLLQNFSGAGHHESSNFVALVIFAIIGIAMALRLRLQIFGQCRLLLWLLFVAPWAGVLVFDFVMHTYTVAYARYAIAALPIACLLAGAGLSLLAGGTRRLLLVLVLVAWAPNSLIYEQTGKRVTARHRAEIISAKESSTDLILIDAIPSGLLNIARYLKGPAPIASWMPTWVPQPMRQIPESIRDLAAGRTRILWVGGAGSAAVTPEKDWLRANAVVVEETRIFTDFRPKDAATF